MSTMIFTIKKIKCLEWSPFEYSLQTSSDPGLQQNLVKEMLLTNMRILCVFERCHSACLLLNRNRLCRSKEIFGQPLNNIFLLSSGRHFTSLPKQFTMTMTVMTRMNKSMNTASYNALVRMKNTFSSRKTNILCCLQFSRSYAKGRLPFEVNTNVSKDVLLYSHSNDLFYKLLSLFGVVQFLFFGYLARFSYKTLRDAPSEGGEAKIREVSSWKHINLGANKYRNGIVLMCMSVGYLALFATCMYPLRAVMKLWLLRGGQAVRVTTYAPFGKKYTIVTPLDNVSCVQARTDSHSNIPMKIKGKWFFYLMDKRGNFYDTKLFDFSVGLKRSLK